MGTNQKQAVKVDSQGQPEKKKSKAGKVFAAIFIPIGAIVLIAAVLLILITDLNKCSFQGSDTYTTQQLVAYESAGGLDDVKESKQFKLQFSQDSMDQILYDSYKSINNDTLKAYAKNLYVVTSEDSYTFYIDLEASILRSRLAINTSLVEGSVNGKDAYIFKINSAKTGYIDLYPIIKATGLLDNSMFEQLFGSAGISIHSDMGNDRFYYYKESIATDIVKFVGSDDDLLASTMSHFAERDDVGALFQKEGIGLGIDLSRSITNTNYISDEFNKTVNMDLEGCKTKVLTMASENVVKTEQEATKLFMYLLNGYASSKDNVKAYIDSIDLTPIGITDKTNYRGYHFDLESNETIEAISIIQAAENAASLNPNEEKKIISINEDQISKVIRSTGLLKKGYTLFGKDINGVPKFNYITVDNFYVNIVKDAMYLIIGVNYGGLETRLVLDFNVKANIDDALAITLSVNDIYYGEHIAGDKLKETVRKYISDAVKDSKSDIMSYNEETKEITFSFRNTIKDVPVVGEILTNHGSSRLCLEGNGINDLGAVNLYFTFTA